MTRLGRHATLGFLLVPAGLAVLAGTARGQTTSATLRVALVSQWTVDQHRVARVPGPVGRLAPEFEAALDRGVVDRVVFWWQRGAIQRSALVPKSVRVLAGPEAEALGGRGEFQLLDVRPPRGAAAWTEVEVASRTGRPDDVLVIEVGGDTTTLGQVLETLLVAAPSGPLVQLSLGRRAVIPHDGVQVLVLPSGQSLGSPATAGLFRGREGMAFLVARSPVETIANAAVAPSGLADLAFAQGGEWRDSDRLFVRMPLAVMRGGAPALVLGWKDRVLKPDPEGVDVRRGQSRLLLPRLR